MRSVWVSLVLLIVIAALAVADSYFMCQSIEEMSYFLEEMKEEETIDPVKTEAAEAVFRKTKWLFAISVSMTAVDATESAFLLLNSAAKNQSAAEASAALVSFEYALNRLREAAAPSFETVF